MNAIWIMTKVGHGGYRKVIGAYTNAGKMSERFDTEADGWELFKTWNNKDDDIFYRDYYRDTTCEYGPYQERMTIETIVMEVNA